MSEADDSLGCANCGADMSYEGNRAICVHCRRSVYWRILATASKVNPVISALLASLLIVGIATALSSLFRFDTNTKIALLLQVISWLSFWVCFSK